MPLLVTLGNKWVHPPTYTHTYQYSHSLSRALSNCPNLTPQQTWWIHILRRVYHQQNLTGGNNFNSIRGLLRLKFTGSAAKSHSLGGQTVQTLGLLGGWGVSYFQKSVDPRCLYCFNTVFPMEPGVGGVGVGSSFLVPDIFQRSKWKHNALRVISKPSEELHVLLISIKSPRHFCHLSFCAEVHSLARLRSQHRYQLPSPSAFLAGILEARQRQEICFPGSFAFASLLDVVLKS